MALSYDDFKEKYKPQFDDINEAQYDEAVSLAQCKFAAGCCGTEAQYANILSYLTAHYLHIIYGNDDITSVAKDTTSESLGGASVSFAQNQTKFNVPFGDPFYNTTKWGQLFAQMARTCGYLGRVI